MQLIDGCLAAIVNGRELARVRVQNVERRVLPAIELLVRIVALHKADAFKAHGEQEAPVY